MIQTLNEFFVYSEEIRRYYCKRENTPFQNYVGQNQTIEKLLDLMYQGYSNRHHLVADNIMLAGPPSTGKTTLAKMFADALATPAVLTDYSQVNKGMSVSGVNIAGGAETVIHLVLDAWAKTDWGPLEGNQAGSLTLYEPPPMIVFIDEMHGLTRKVADALLKATERNDGMLFGKSNVMNCGNITWIGATTDWGKLPGAFRTRFPRYDLESPTFDEVVEIVRINTQWDLGTCKKIVFYGTTVPRETLAFVREVERYAARAGVAHKDCIWECAERNGIDRWGMKKQRVELLKSLKNGPLILRNLCAAIHCEMEEVVKYWLPPLLFSKPAMVRVERSTYNLTDEGRKALALRGF